MYTKYRSQEGTGEIKQSGATSHSTSEQGMDVFNAHHNIKVKVFSGDISKIQTDVVLSENNGEPAHQLPEETKLLHKAVGPQLSNLPKDETSQEGLQMTHTGGTRSPFTYLFHVPVKRYCSTERDAWERQMTLTYECIFKIADVRKARSLSMPLLSHGAPTDIAAQTAVKVIAGYKPQGTVKEFNIVTLDRKFTSEIASVCRRIFPIGNSDDSSQHCDEDSSASGDIKKKTLEKTNAKHGTEKLKQRRRISQESIIGPSNVQNVVDKLASSKLSYHENGERIGSGASSVAKFSPSLRSAVKKSSHKSSVNGVSGDVAYDVNRVYDVDRDETGYQNGDIDPREDDGLDTDVIGATKQDGHTFPDEDKTKVKEQDTKSPMLERDEEQDLTKEQNLPETEGHQEQSATDQNAKENEVDTCVICMDIVSDPKKLEKCGHVFCRACIDKCFQTFKPICPSCNTVYGVIVGDQPPGSMTCSTTSERLPGYEQYKTIVINYSFSNGIQTKDHPHPGKTYHGTHRTAYLPDSPEGQKVSRLLKIAFDRKLTFTVGRSATTGKDDCVIWNDIHHKTNTLGGAQGFGYPDPTYLTRVQEELASKGVVDD